MSAEQRELAELFARQQQIRDAAIEELAEMLEEAADRIEFLETQIENAKSALDWFIQPSLVGTKVFDAAEKARWKLDGQPDGADA